VLLKPEVLLFPHIATLDDFGVVGATSRPARVGRDGNRFIGDGVSAGIDFALDVVAASVGGQEAKEN